VTVGAGEILGWDIGGANIKLVRIQPDRRDIQTVVERAFPIWRELDRLPSVLAVMANDVSPTAAMALTMTAELADCFATKREGVAAVIGAAEQAFPASTLWVYGIDGRFLTPEDARRQPHSVAAANWMASATLVARVHRDALFLDVGSTTTDIIPIVAGQVAAVGRTDPDRLRSGELVYTGCLRTPVCAAVRSLPLAGGRCRVAAEHFAITADVYRWLGQIAEDDYTCDTPDGRGRSRSEAGARLARMVCADSEALSERDVTAIASHVARAQAIQIAHGIRQVLRRLRRTWSGVAVVAGSGAFIARAAAEAAGVVVCECVGSPGANAWRAAPAAAVAYLLAEQFSEAVRADRRVPPKRFFRGGGPVPPKRSFRGGGPVPPKRSFRGGG
jgi:probable H4MPT-linked C1 transfer pathway protein